MELSAEGVARSLLIEGRTEGDEFYALLESLQAHDPLYRMANDDIWVATGYDEVREILLAPGVEKGFAAKNDVTQPGWREHRSRTNMLDWMGQYDGAAHVRMRGAVNSYFLPAMANAAEAHLRPAIHGVVAAFKAAGGGEFLSEVGYGVTAKVTDYLLGLEGLAHADFREPIARMMKTFDFPLTEEDWREADEAADMLRAFWSGHIAHVGEDPTGDDVLARLLRSRKLDGHEVVLVAENILAAGSDTTANTSANALHLLLRTPDQLALARSSSAARSKIADEALRLVSPAPTSGRLTAREITVCGRTIPANAVVLTMIAAANRDPKIFPDPHRMDLARASSPRPIAFGTGPHICLGQWFARKAINILFDELLNQCATIRFHGVPPELSGIGMRQLPQLVIEVA
jgi:cytochrome P450